MSATGGAFDRAMNEWLVERLHLDPNQIPDRGGRSFQALAPGAMADNPSGPGYIEGPDGNMLVYWTGMATIPLAEYEAKLAEVRHATSHDFVVGYDTNDDGLHLYCAQCDTDETLGFDISPEAIAAASAQHRRDRA